MAGSRVTRIGIVQYDHDDTAIIYEKVQRPYHKNNRAEKTKKQRNNSVTLKIGQGRRMRFVSRGEASIGCYPSGFRGSKKSFLH